jgi:hypothetical protein
MLKKFSEQIAEENEVMTETVSEELDAVQASEDAVEVVAEEKEEVVAEDTVSEAKAPTKSESKKSVKAEEEEEDKEEDEEEVAESKKSVKSEEDDMEDEEDDDDDDDDDEDDDEELEASKKYESKKSVKKEEVELTVDVKEDVDALLSGSDAELSEEFKEKAQTVFEAALKAKVGEQLDSIKESMEAEYETKLDEARTELAAKVDDYLNYVVEAWVQDNALAIEKGIRTEIAEEFMAGLKNLFVENYIDVPEEKADLVDELAEKADDLEAKLNEEFEKSVAMKKELDEFKAKEALAEATQGLVDVDADKLRSLAEGVEFETLDQYREKLETIKESYFPKVRATGAEKEDSIDDGSEPKQELSETMSVYARTLSSMRK